MGVLLSLPVVLCGAFPGAELAANSALTQAEITVHEARGTYNVSARFRVAQPLPIVLAVLTDYERIPHFMPNVKTSVVLERRPGGAVVRQEAISRMMMFSKRVYLTLDVQEGSDYVRFRDLSGRSFEQYVGAWQLSRGGGHTIITYELEAQPSFDVPEFLLRRLLRRDAKQMIDRLQVEMVSRSARDSIWP